MPVFLKHRNEDLVEFMDREDCDLEKLNNTYRQFSTINSLLSGWRRIYNQLIKPELTSPDRIYTFLDIGFGGGDIPLKIARWANNDGFKVEVLGIELDDRALEFVKMISTPTNVQFRKIHLIELINQGEQFDFVLSNHLLHHLNNKKISVLLQQSESLARIKVVFSDIHRSDLGYGLYSLFTRPFFRKSFITPDGLMSIRRSFTKKELEKITPEAWQVLSMPLYRLLLIRDKT